MDAVQKVLKEELEYESTVLERYQKAIKELPKGTLSKKRINGINYFYLAYREGSKIKTVYLGKLNRKEIKEYQEKIAKRKRYKELLRYTQKTIQYLQKVLCVKTV